MQCRVHGIRAYILFPSLIKPSPQESNKTDTGSSGTDLGSGRQSCLLGHHDQDGTKRGALKCSRTAGPFCAWPARIVHGALRVTLCGSALVRRAKSCQAVCGIRGAAVGQALSLTAAARQMRLMSLPHAFSRMVTTWTLPRHWGHREALPWPPNAGCG